ncbi:hypothetical protein ACF0H5_001157 [Mactra antiquata]
MNPTLHRRMDRCFLKTMNGIDKQQMLANRKFLYYLAHKASVTSLLPQLFCAKLQEFVQNPVTDGNEAKLILNSMRSYAPEKKDLICESMNCHNGYLPFDIRLFIQYILKECLSLNYIELLQLHLNLILIILLSLGGHITLIKMG